MFVTQLKKQLWLLSLLGFVVLGSLKVRSEIPIFNPKIGPVLYALLVQQPDSSSLLLKSQVYSNFLSLSYAYEETDFDHNFSSLYNPQSTSNWTTSYCKFIKSNLAKTLPERLTKKGQALVKRELLMSYLLTLPRYLLNRPTSESNEISFREEKLTKAANLYSSNMNLVHGNVARCLNEEYTTFKINPSSYENSDSKILFEPLLEKVEQWIETCEL